MSVVYIYIFIWKINKKIENIIFVFKKKLVLFLKKKMHLNYILDFP